MMFLILDIVVIKFILILPKEHILFQVTVIAFNWFFPIRIEDKKNVDAMI